MKKTIGKVFAVILAALIIGGCFACNETSKSRTSRRWGITIPENAREVYKSYEGGKDTSAYYVYNADKNEISFEMKPMDEFYKVAFMQMFRPVYSERVPENMTVNWEHELYGYYAAKKSGSWKLFCVFDADEDLLYVMDTDI